ncbi:MAG: CopG family transcriptional regulator [Deltaproteobacteria bacterium]|nr:CopG family transcriptional regulator [Deltaproteobacteria bacterium]
MIRTQISFDKRLYDLARRAARRRGVSLAEMCRRGLSIALAEDGDAKPWMKHAGTVASGDPKASSSIDAVVYGRREL